MGEKLFVPPGENTICKISATWFYFKNYNYFFDAVRLYPIRGVCTKNMPNIGHFSVYVPHDSPYGTPGEKLFSIFSWPTPITSSRFNLSLFHPLQPELPYISHHFPHSSSCFLPGSKRFIKGFTKENAAEIWMKIPEFRPLVCFRAACRPHFDKPC